MHSLDEAIYQHLFSGLKITDTNRHSLLYSKSLINESLERTDYYEMERLIVLYSEFNNNIYGVKDEINIACELPLEDVGDNYQELINKINNDARYTSTSLFTVWAGNEDLFQPERISFNCCFNIYRIKVDYYTWNELDYLAKRWEKFVMEEILTWI